MSVYTVMSSAAAGRWGSNDDVMTSGGKPPSTPEPQRLRRRDRRDNGVATRWSVGASSSVVDAEIVAVGRDNESQIPLRYLVRSWFEAGRKQVRS